MTTHNSWRGMRERCSNPAHNSYHNYGGRGIRVPPEWESFALFERDMGPKPSENHSLDRVDTNADYGPDNCRWATRAEQANNTRANVRIEVGGETRTLTAWAAHLDVPVSTLHHRLRAGWTPEAAVCTPFTRRPTELQVTINGRSQTPAQWAAEVGISRKLITRRIRAGWPEAELLTPPDRGRRRIK